MNLRKFFRQIRAIQLLSSIKITVTCLSLLFFLTLTGTIDQVNNGLYHAQENYFYSLGFLMFGFLPFPGAQLVLWSLFINLLCVTITRFVFNWSRIGILIIHFGLLSYFVAAFVTFYTTKESNLTLMEGAGSNVSSAYREWELSVWEKKAGAEKNIVNAVDLKNITAGTTLDLEKFGLKISVHAYYPNSEAYVNKDKEADKKLINASDIQSLKNIPFIVKEPEKNFPGAVLHVETKEAAAGDLLLYGGETKATELKTPKHNYAFQLRRKRSPLPFLLTLKDFKMEVHPNTTTARSYQSLVEIKDNEVGREVLISMNHPLRYKDFTFYQASYSIDAMGREISTLAVVENFGRLLPYISCFITFAGLATHFFLMAVFKRERHTV